MRHSRTTLPYGSSTYDEALGSSLAQESCSASVCANNCEEICFVVFAWYDAWISRLCPSRGQFGIWFVFCLDFDMPIANPPPFEEELTSSFQELRKALGSIVVAGGLRPNEPQDMARRWGISRNLTWKLSKVLCAQDMLEAMHHLPGDEGIGIMIRAAEKRGTDRPLVDDVRAALTAFNRVIEVHSGDRATLELMLNGWGPRGSSERLEQSRKLAYRGNCGVWGAQARVRCQTSVVMPNLEKPDLLDVALVGGIVDFRRLRANIRWPLFRPRLYHDNYTPMVHGPGEIALDPAYADTAGPKLIAEFCSANMPPIKLVEEPSGPVYELSEGPVGNSGTFTCFFGTVMPAVATRYASPGDEHGELSTQMLLPAEWLLFDLLMHRDLEVAGLETFTVGRLGNANFDAGSMRLPMDEQHQELSGQPPVLSSDLVDRYENLVDYTLKRLDRPRREFRAYRLLVRYPLMHSNVIVRFPLPQRD